MEAFHGVSSHATTGSDIVLGFLRHAVQQVFEAVYLGFACEDMLSMVLLAIFLLCII